MVHRFAEAGDRVFAIDRAEADSVVTDFLGSFGSSVRFIQADLRDRTWYDALPPDRIDVVVHAAAVTNQRLGEELERAAAAVAVNIGGTVNLLDWALQVQPRRVVHASSGAIYGRLLEGSSPLDEATAVDPVNVYAITKFAGERLALRYRIVAGLDVVVARLPSQYGPMERDTGDRTRLSIIHEWCNAALKGDEILVNRSQLPRDYTFVYDVADAIRELSLSPKLHHEIYNISTGLDITQDDIVAVLRDLFPELRVRYYDEPVSNPNDRRRLSPERLLCDTTWKPGFDLRRAVETYVGYLRERPLIARPRAKSP